MKEVFDNLAKHYDRRVPYLPKFFEIAAKRLELTRESRLLDIACGTGELCSGFADYCGDITGIDQSTEMLARARERLPERVRFVQCDVNNGPPDDLGQYDAAVIGRALRYLDRAPLSKLLHGSLRGGGSILVCGAGIHDSTVWFRTLRHVANRHKDRLLVPKQSRHTALENTPYERGELFWVVGEWAFSIDDLLNNLLSYGAMTARGDEEIAEVRSSLAKNLRPFMDENGLLAGKIVSHGTQYARRTAM